jgi:hypothetical protein
LTFERHFHLKKSQFSAWSSAAIATMGCGTSQQTTVPGALPQVSVQATFVGASGNDAKHVAVILPGGYTKLMQPNEKYHYHILETRTDLISSTSSTMLDKNTFIRQNNTKDI